MNHKNVKRQAILILGPTGSGKTPLGEYLESSGLQGKRCAHFDFGANLRELAGGKSCCELLTPEDVQVVSHLLRTGALLEMNQFHIARKILTWFMDGRGMTEEDWVILNGMPRHIGQAEGVADIVDVKKVVYLECESRVIVERIRLNAGGDRTGRVDDSESEIAAKLKLFQERTVPLLDHYHGKGIRIVRVRIKERTMPRDVALIIGG